MEGGLFHLRNAAGKRLMNSDCVIVTICQVELTMQKKNKNSFTFTLHDYTHAEIQYKTYLQSI